MKYKINFRVVNFYFSKLELSTNILIDNGKSYLIEIIQKYAVIWASIIYIYKLYVYYEILLIIQCLILSIY